MPVYSRTSVNDGQSVMLRAVFTDQAGNFITPTSPPQVYIYDESTDFDLIYAEIDSAVFVLPVAGPLVPTEISTGFYEVEYTVPAGANMGLWVDLWLADIETTQSYNLLGFTVSNGADISAQRLGNNELIVIELDHSITSYTGLTLASDVQLSFITRLVPFYVSPDILRMETGPWIDFIPDSTLALMIHWASKEADFIMAGTRSSAKRVQFARAKFVSYDAILRTLYLPGSGSYQVGGNGAGGGLSKRLGDLSISNSSGATIARTASGIDTNTLEHIRSQRDEWWRVVNAGATIMPGQSLGFEGALRGAGDPDRRMQGRLWAEPGNNFYMQPGVNSKGVPLGGRKGKFYFRSPMYPFPNRCY